jgi:hypothetical protein
MGTRNPGLTFLVALLLGCGSRTGLLELADAGAPVDARPEADADAKASPPDAEDAIDAEIRTTIEGCPNRPPKAGSACHGASIECAYVTKPDAHPDGLEGWCCSDSSGWAECAMTVCWCARPSKNSNRCYDTTCSINVCITDEGKTCCTCSSDGTNDDCKPCKLK